MTLIEFPLIYYTHANFHDIAAAITGTAVALEVTGHVPAGAIPADSVHDLALVDIWQELKSIRCDWAY